MMVNLCRHQHRRLRMHVTCYYSLSSHALLTMTSLQGDLGSPVYFWASHSIDAERRSLIFSFHFLQGDSSPQQNGAGLFGGRSKSSPDAPTGPQKQKKIGAKLVDAKPAFGDEVCRDILLIQFQLLRAQYSVWHVIGLHRQ